MHTNRFLLALICTCIAVAPCPAPEPEAPGYETKADHDPNGIGKFYMDREIARVMSHFGAGWLDRPERIKEEEPKKLYGALKIQPGNKVADIGAGSGFHTFRMSEEVGEKGTVYAVDIQPEMLAIIKKKAKAKGVENVELVKGEIKDPKLPAGKVDLILMVDVYHEFEFPFEMTRNLVEALAPGGRLVFVEFRLEDRTVPIKLVHKMTERQVIKEMSIHPEMKHQRTVRSLPWQHVVIFEKKKE